MRLHAGKLRAFICGGMPLQLLPLALVKFYLKPPHRETLQYSVMPCQDFGHPMRALPGISSAIDHCQSSSSNCDALMPPPHKPLPCHFLAFSYSVLPSTAVPFPPSYWMAGLLLPFTPYSCAPHQYALHFCALFWGFCPPSPFVHPPLLRPVSGLESRVCRQCNFPLFTTPAMVQHVCLI